MQRIAGLLVLTVLALLSSSFFLDMRLDFLIVQDDFFDIPLNNSSNASVSREQIKFKDALNESMHNSFSTYEQDNDALNESMHNSFSTYEQDNDANANECTCLSMHAQDGLSDNSAMDNHDKKQCDMDNTVLHCRMHTAGQEGHGYFQIRANSTIQHIAAFVRINGPTIDTILFEPQDNESVWKANYCTHLQGNYSAAVYIYLRSSSPEDILIPGSGVCVDPLFHKPFTFLWSAPDITESQCPTLWYWESNATDASNDLSKYKCPPRDDYTTAYSGLRNRAPEVNTSDFKPSGKVCLFGDSQIRNLLNSIGGLLDPLSCFPLLQQIVYRGDCDVDGFQWKGFRYDFQWEYDEDMRECTHVFLNFGQWPLGWPSQPTPWLFDRYRRAVSTTLQHLIHLKELHPHIKLTWVTTNPHTISGSLLTCPPTDWRYPHLIREYNRIAIDAIQRTSNGSIRVLDTWSIIFPLFDLSFDSAHYQVMSRRN
jgi:hypothetical protein